MFLSFFHAREIFIFIIVLDMYAHILYKLTFVYVYVVVYGLLEKQIFLGIVRTENENLPIFLSSEVKIG